jgi:hypothetical protein
VISKKFFLVPIVLTFVLFTTGVLIPQEQIVVIGWNAESGDANPDTVGARIAAIDGCDIWGMCEIRNTNWADQFEISAEDGEGADFSHVLGSTGGSDRMQIIFNSDRFELIESYELHRINLGGSVRAPLVAHFRIITTGTEFLFMVNHLYRSKAEQRAEQGSLLNLWASSQTLPIIAVGDYNFDWDVDQGEIVHDKGYDNMAAQGRFTWVRPRSLKKTQASPDFDSVLDFIFLGGDSWTWNARSIILQRDVNDNNDDVLSDNNQVSDHRPVRATITIE